MQVDNWVCDRPGCGVIMENQPNNYKNYTITVAGQPITVTVRWTWDLCTDCRALLVNKLKEKLNE